MQISLTYAYYEIDPIGFIERLCENKDAPELECNGKCQLKKVTESSSNETNTPNIIDFKEILLYSETPYNYELTDIVSIKHSNNFYINHYNYSTYNDVFHPPQL